jgi:methionyl-tRNA formyltransferase
MPRISTVFFGSTTDSVIVLEALSNAALKGYDLVISALVTQPPRPVGRKQIITPTPVELWGKEHNVPVLSFPSNIEKPSLYENEETVIRTLQPFKADLLISASYGQKIPTPTIKETTYGGLNVHPSLLPRWRGADPVPWAISTGDHQTGVTVVTISEQFDQGVIIGQKKIPITPNDTTDPLRAQLFTMGAALLISILPDYVSGTLRGNPQGPSDTPFVRRLTRTDGFEPWAHIEKALGDSNEAMRIERKFRAFTPWPGLWSTVQIQGEEKRLKVIACHMHHELLVIDTVQLEGKNPISFDLYIKTYQNKNSS